MAKSSVYQSKTSDNKGVINWSEEENQIWAELYAKQLPLLKTRACSQYMEGLSLLALPDDRIPQLPDIDKVLLAQTLSLIHI